MRLKLLCLILVLCGLFLECAIAATSTTMNVGIVSSLTGSLTDWNDTVAGYQFWAYKMNSLYPSGLPIKDNQGHTYNVQIALTIQDDTSNSSVHSALVTNMVTSSGGVDFVLNANPSFAVNEAQIVSSANKINIHAVTGNPNVFALQLPGVYTVAPTSDTYVTNLFQEYRINSFKELVFVERSDNDELYQACQEAILTAKANLLSYVEVKYTAGANMTAVAMSINSTTTVDALVGCMTSEEALTLYKILDNFRKPIKSLYFLNGPGNSTWTAQLGGLSEYVTGLAIWTSTLTNAQDELFGTTTAYTTAFSTWAGVTTPTDHNAGASAAGYALYYAIMNAFSLCDLSNTGGSAYQMLYGTLNCSDNQNNGMKRVISTLQLESVTTFFGNIAFNKNGENYDAVPEVIQVFTVTQDLKVVNAPAVVLPSSKAQQTITIPQPNRYAPVCPAGTIQNPNDYDPCIPCPTGYYQSSVGQTACQICANDYYANETGSSACYACPANTITLNKGTANPGDCLCQVGYYNEEKSGGYACQACPNAANCNGGTSWPSPQAGWYAEPDAPFLMYNCNPGLYCLGNYTCAEGYTKRMCMYCDTSGSGGNKYFMTMNRCYQCPNVAVIYIGLMLMYGLFIWINLAVTRGVEIFHVVMNFCQMLSLISNYNTNWPNLSSNVMNFATVLSFETDILQPQCINPYWTFEHNLIVQMLMPLGMTAIVVVWTMSTYMGYRIKMLLSSAEESEESDEKLDPADISEIASLRKKSNTDMSVERSMQSFGSMKLKALGESGFFITLQNFMHMPSNKTEWLETFYERMSLPLLFLDVSYVVNLKYCLMTFFCYDFMGSQYVYYMPEEHCYSEKHWSLIMIAITGLVVYCGGYWIVLCTTLHHMKKSNSFADKVPHLIFGWMYEKYQAQWYWYQLVTLMQRTIYCTIMVFMLSYPDIQLLITFIVGSFILVLDVKSESYIDPLCNWMANTSESILLMITIMGLMLYNPLTLQSTIDAFQNLILIFVIGYVALGVLLIALEGFFQMYISVLKSRHNTIAKKWGHKIRRYRFMYDFFTPMFMFRWLSKAKLEDWQDWHKLCVMLVDYSHPTCEASYLSSKKIGKFWRYMLHSFPETIDYLATVDLSHREHFSEYIEVMYQYFFETKDEVQHQLHDIINDKYRAPFAQFLAGADDEEIAFVNKVMKSAFEKARGKAAVREMAVAANRAKSATSARNAESMNHVESSFNSFSKSMESMPTPSTKAVVVAAMSTIDDKDFGKVSEIHMKEETSEISSSGGKSTPSEDAKRETLVSSEVELAAIRSSGNDVMPFDSVEPPRTFYAGSHEAVHPGAAAPYLDEFEDILDLPAQRQKSQAAWDNIEAQLTIGTSMSQKSRSGSRGVSRAGGSVVNNVQDIQPNAEVQDEDAGSRVWPTLRAAEVTNSYVPPQPILETVSSFRHDSGELEDEIAKLGPPSEGHGLQGP